MNENPKAALDALTTRSGMTLGKMALLCRMNSPVLAGDVSDICETLAAIHVHERPLSESVAAFDGIRGAAVEFYGDLSPEEYRAKAARLLDEVAAFIEMLPRPAPGAKKNSETDGARN